MTPLHLQEWLNKTGSVSYWLDGYAKVKSAGVHWKAGCKWSLEGRVNNLTDKATSGYVFNGPFRPVSSGTFIDEARTFGVTVRTKF